eukprot:m.50457 g.50457  ORF g.50457 m.50457 type:complete len:1406 (-) comp11164_c0_seq1:2280-6497(-)
MLQYTLVACVLAVMIVGTYAPPPPIPSPSPSPSPAPTPPPPPSPTPSPPPPSTSTTDCNNSKDCDSGTYCNTDNECKSCDICAYFEDEITHRRCVDACLAPPTGGGGGPGRDSPEDIQSMQCTSTLECGVGYYCDKTLEQCTNCTSCTSEINDLPCPVVCESQGSCQAYENCNPGSTFCSDYRQCMSCDLCGTSETFAFDIFSLPCRDLRVCSTEYTACNTTQDCTTGRAYCGINAALSPAPTCIPCTECGSNASINDTSSVPCTQLCDVCQRANLTTISGHLDLEAFALTDDELTCILNRADFPTLQVTTLRLRFNQLSVMPNVSALTNLEDLMLSNNEITSVPSSTVWPSQLTSLSINNNNLTRLERQDWPSTLQVLNMHSNLLTSLGNQTWPDSLAMLSVSRNRLTTIVNQTWPASLQRIELLSNYLVSIDSVTWPDTIQHLDLSYNYIPTIANRTWPSSLQALLLSNNLLQHPPYSLTGALPASLVVLELQTNQISSLDDFRCPPGLLELDLSENSISTIDAVGFADTIENLFLSSNSLTDVQSVFWPTNLLELTLESNDITAVPTTWPMNLNTLNLAGNAITSIDGQAWPTKLVELNLSDNQLTSIANQTWPERLRTLYLGSNLITTPIDSATEFPGSVEVLQLHNNRIPSIDMSPLPIALYTFTCYENELTEVPSNMDLFTDITSLDLSINKITNVTGAQTWPPYLEKLILDNNLLDHPTHANFSSLPITVTSISIDFNPWESWSSSAYTMQTGDPVFTALLETLPCALSGFSMLSSPLPWNCSVELASPTSTELILGTDAAMLFYGNTSSCVLDNATETMDSAYFWTCGLTQEGESLVQATDAFRSYVFELTNDKYVRFYQVALPVCGLAVFAFLGVDFIHKRSIRKLDYVVAVLIFISAFDIASDWAFYTIEISSSGFEDAYNCVESPPSYACNVSDTFYSCVDFGDLHSPCGEGKANQLENPQNECECEGFYCLDHTDIASACDLFIFGADVMDLRMDLSCDDFNGLDTYAPTTCGYVTEVNPAANGTNECECMGHTCIISSQTSCRGLSGGNYNALRYSCFGSVMVASVIFFLSWRLKLRTALKHGSAKITPLDEIATPQQKMTSSSSTHSLPVERSIQVLVAGSEVSTFKSSDVPRKSSQTPRPGSDADQDLDLEDAKKLLDLEAEHNAGTNVEVLLTVLGLFLEDVSQFVFQIIYVSVLGVTDNQVVLATLISTIAAMVVTSVFLANRDKTILIRYGGIFGKIFVWLFSFGGCITRSAAKYRRRLAKKKQLRLEQEQRRDSLHTYASNLREAAIAVSQDGSSTTTKFLSVNPTTIIRTPHNSSGVPSAWAPDTDAKTTAMSDSAEPSKASPVPDVPRTTRLGRAWKAFKQSLEDFFDFVGGAVALAIMGLELV